jgi:hypothetical protein
MPAIIPVDSEGKPRSSHHDPEFQVRLDRRLLKAAAQAMIEPME